MLADFVETVDERPIEISVPAGTTMGWTGAGAGVLTAGFGVAATASGFGAGATGFGLAATFFAAFCFAASSASRLSSTSSPSVARFASSASRSAISAARRASPSSSVRTCPVKCTYAMRRPLSQFASCTIDGSSFLWSSPMSSPWRRAASA